MTNNNFFSKEKQEQALKWLKEKADLNSRACEICQSKEWILIEDLIMPLRFTKGGGILLGGACYPHVLITCNNCGNSKIFNAVKMGLLEEKQREKDGE